LPNSGHFWTPQEELDAWAVDDYQVFAQLYPHITETAHRIRRGVLARQGWAAASAQSELMARTKVPCKLCGFLRGLPLGEAITWRADLALSAAAVSHIAVVEALSERGVEIDETSVRRHRRNHNGK
jgi:hypothetical protein